MDIAAILALIAKGITIIDTLVQAGKDAAPAIKALSDVVSGAQKGTVTDADLDATETLLDSLIADFNTEMPPE